MGLAGLVLGWTLEFLRSEREREHPRVGWVEWWERCRRPVPVWAVVQKVVQRYRWPYLLAGAAALGVAKLNWWFETAETYWVWHSLWHCSIYGSAFLFLCATEEAEAEAEAVAGDDLAGVPLQAREGGDRDEALQTRV